MRWEYDPLFHEEGESEPWEALLKAQKEGRHLSREELDRLDKDAVRAAFHHGLVDEERARQRITDIQDEARERSWYED